MVKLRGKLLWKNYRILERDFGKPQKPDCTTGPLVESGTHDLLNMKQT
jgi:hypothetical protein